jgi:hypothetical protein
MWRTGMRGRLEAMRVADGAAQAGARADPAEVARFRDLAAAVRDASDPGDAAVPSFDAMWAGVERKLDAERAPVAVPREAAGAAPGLLARLLGDRPLFVLAPAGAFLVAVVLGLLFWTRPPAPNNQCFVDSYDAGSGSVIIDQDFDDSDRPTVIWFVEEG